MFSNTSRTHINQTQSRNQKSLGRQALDLFIAGAVILSSTIAASGSAAARPAEQATGTTSSNSTIFLPVTMNGASPVSEVLAELDDNHDHAHDDDNIQEPEATDATAYMILDPHIVAADDGTLSIDKNIIPSLAAESGIAAGVFNTIVAELTIANADQTELDEDELPVLGTDLGCRYYPFRKRGNRDWWVWNVQNKLNANHQFGLAKDSIYGSQTQTAVRKLQQYWRNQGRTACGKRIDVDGMVGRQTWALLYNTRTSIGRTAQPPVVSNGYRQPTLGGSTGLCAYGQSHKRFGKGQTMQRLENVGKSYKQHGEGYISVGNISLSGGGYMSPHSSHQVGLDVDLRPMRNNNGQCGAAMQWNWNGYDQDATRKLVKALRATGRIKLIYFNDPVLIREGLVTKYSGHDNHLHVRFCEPGHSNYRYRC